MYGDVADVRTSDMLYGDVNDVRNSGRHSTQTYGDVNDVRTRKYDKYIAKLRSFFICKSFIDLQF